MTRRIVAAALVAAGLIAPAVGIVRAGAQDAAEADLERASGGRTVRVRLGTGGSASIVELPTEVYVARVLAGEGEPRAAAAAQQALAIAIRTFAAASTGRHRRDAFDLCDTTHCQVLRPSTPASRAAALATASQVLTYDGRPALVFYSASCGGRSESAADAWIGGTDIPYLRSAADDAHDGEARWTLQVPIARVEQTLRRIGFEGRRLRDVSVERRTGSGRVLRLRLNGFRPDAIAGDDFRMAMGAREIRSTYFDVSRNGGHLQFTGRGYGHGVGLCVVGAGRRAARGETAAEILEQYYPGVRVAPASGNADVVAPAVHVVPVDAPRTTRAHDLARQARADLARALGIASPPDVRVEVHESLEAFRTATGHPWWAGFSVAGGVVELAPLSALEQSRDGLEGSVRRAVAEALLATAYADRPAWVRVGGARYYATAPRVDLSARRVKCPSDAELTMPVSASAHRVAELRAEACFARALAEAGDWRQVR